MHPFDLRSLLLARHAQHVVLIHFPIALFLCGFAFDVMARFHRGMPFATAARYNLIAAAIVAPPTLLTGILAWRWALEGSPLQGILLWHLVSGTMATLLMILVAYLHIGIRSTADPSAGRLLLESATALVIGLTAHLGGFLSGVNT